MDIDAELRACELAELLEHEARESTLGAAMLLHPTYTFERFHQSLCADLDEFTTAIERKESPRYMIFVGPQHGKSTLASRTLPARTIGKHPDWPIQISSYAVSLASEHSRWVRNAMERSSFQNAFPGCEAAGDSAAKDFFHTTQGGSVLATGVDGGQTGFPSRMSIIDDPFKNRQEADSVVIRQKVKDWYPTSVRTRLADGGGILILNTRWHQDDLCGWLLDEAKKNPDAEQWKVIVYSAIAEEDESFRKKGEPLCPRLHSLKDLQSIRSTIPARDWLALYQQRPVGDEGGYFQKAWMRTYDTSPRVGTIHLAADLAYKTGQDNDRTCIAAFGLTESGDVCFLPGIILDRLDTGASVEAILDLAKQHGAHTLAVGRDMIQGAIGPFLKKRMNERRIWLTIEEIPQKSDKEARARSFQARMQQGKVLFPSGTLWNELIQPELLAFPGGKHDDCVDMCAHACLLLDKLDEHKPTKPKPPENPDVKRWAERSKMQRGNGERSNIIKPLFGS